jgi:hypothetical protein
MFFCMDELEMPISLRPPAVVLSSSDRAIYALKISLDHQLPTGEPNTNALMQRLAV